MLKYFYRVVEKEPYANVLQYCAEGAVGGIAILKEIDPMEAVNSGISWGYSGEGPRALTELLIMELTKDKFSSLSNAEYNSYYKPILEFISIIDMESDFKIYLETLQKICNKEIQW
jgi:hypothetical protein